MEIFIEKENKKLKMRFSGTARELLNKLKINSEEVIVIKNEELVTLEEKLIDKDKIKILSVISGG